MSPNPFNPSTKIKYSLPSGAQYNVSLQVYDILGNEIVTLVNEKKTSGVYEVEFEATKLTSGIYFYQLKADSPEGQVFIQTNKMILLR